MKKALKRALRFSGFVLGGLVLLAVAAALLLVLDKPLVRNILESRLEKATGMAVRLGRLDYSIFPFRFSVESLELGDEKALGKRSVALARLEGRGDILKLVRGLKPALDSVEAGGLVFHLEQKAASDEPADVEALFRQADDLLAWTRGISASDVRLSLSLSGGEAEIRFFDVAVTPDGSGKAAYSIGRGDVRLEETSGRFAWSSGLASSGVLGLRPPRAFETKWSFPSPRTSAGAGEQSAAGLDVSLSGRYDASARTLDVSRLEMEVPGLLGLEGSVSCGFGDPSFVKAKGKALLPDLEAAAESLKAGLPPEFRESVLRGRADLSGAYVFRREGRTDVRDELTAALTFEGAELEYPDAVLPLRLSVSGRVDASGPLREPRFAADLRLSSGKAGAGGFSVASSDIRVVASLSGSKADLSRGDARLRGLEYEAPDGSRVSLDRADLSGSGTMDFAKKSGAGVALKAVLTDLRAVAAGGPGFSLGRTVFSGKGTVDPARKKAEAASFEAALTEIEAGVAGGRRITFDRAEFGGRARLDFGEKKVVLPAVEARVPGLSPFRVSGSAGFGERGESELRLENGGLDVAALREIAAPFLPEGLNDWDLGGEAGLELSARRRAGAGGEWSVSGTLSLAEARFNDPGFSVAGEGLNPVFRFQVSRTPPGDPSFDGSLEIDRGEFLWQSIYVPWTAHPLRLTVSGSRSPETGAWSGLAARVRAPTLGEADLAGSAAFGPGPAFDLRAETRVDLGSLYSLHSRTGVAEEDRLKLEGILGAVLRLQGSGERFSAAGRVTLSGAGFERAATRTELRGLEADLPVHYEKGNPEPPPSEPVLPEEGFLRFGEFRNPFLTLAEAEIPVRAGVNALAVGPAALDLYGGRLSLGRILFHLDPGTGSFQGVGSLSLRDVDISAFPLPAPLSGLTGSIRADFPRLEIGPARIAVSGRGEADVFGGQVVLRDLAVSDPFDPGRAISLNVDLVDLDLKKLTDEVPFGEVTGILRGEIRDLVITYRQPERFDLRVESVRRRGVPQTFSLKAVDNLTVLSAGQPASLGTGRFWMRFVRGFRYAKLGIESTLRNDAFTLNGTIRRHGVEFLVKKPALFGINVINRMPGKKISFKEMTGRLKRIGRSGGTEEPAREETP